ncbi:MAG: isoprenylcysteine carboxylmethyltransferase family protein [Pseudomonadota bacterium]
MQKLRVPLGFLAGIAYLVSAKPFLWSMLLGFPIALLGLAIRAWASGHLRKGMELATSGPYAHCRNPLYFGSFVMALGCALAGRSVAPGALLVGFFLLLYWRVMHAEAAQMRARFGDEYRAAIGLLAVMSILCVKTVAPFPR